MNPAAFRTIGDFALYLESVGELHRVHEEVDPYLEITEIARRAKEEELGLDQPEGRPGDSAPEEKNSLRHSSSQNTMHWY